MTNKSLTLGIVAAPLLIAFTAQAGPPAPVGSDLFVSSYATLSVLEYNGTTGEFVKAFVPSGSGGLDLPTGLVFGPNGNLFVSSANTNPPLPYRRNSVLEYNGTTGAFVKAFVPSDSGGLSGPQGLVFGPDGNLFVSSSFTNSVLEYNGTTGAFVKAFVPSDSSLNGGLMSPAGLVFGTNGNLFVSGFNSNNVLEYNGTTGEFVKAFVPVVDSPPDGSGANGLMFGSNGNLFVSNSHTDSVLEYNGTTGAFVKAFVPSDSSLNGGLDGPQGLVFGPDGNLFVSSAVSNSVLEYNGTTGDFVKAFVPSDSSLNGGLSIPTGLVFHSAPEPATLGLMVLGLLGAGFAGRRRVS